MNKSLPHHDVRMNYMIDRICEMKATLKLNLFVEFFCDGTNPKETQRAVRSKFISQCRKPLAEEYFVVPHCFVANFCEFIVALFPF